MESPEKQSGKTRLLEVLELVCRDPTKVASITAAALFQTVASGTPTLLIDEADAIFAGNSERNEDLRGILNAGNAVGSKVIRGGKDGKPLAYDVFCPKVVAGIATGKLPDTIRDRAVVVPMARKLKSERVERLRRRRLTEEVEALRDELRLWAQRHIRALERYDLPGPLEEISDRMEEAWEPLLAIADLAGGDWPDRARQAALALSGRGEVEDSSIGVVLLAAVHDAIGDAPAMFTEDILDAINLNEELPFGGWSDGRGLDARTLAKKLRPYGIKPRGTIRIGDNTKKGYRAQDMRDAWRRYLPAMHAAVASEETTEPPDASQNECDGSHDPYPSQKPPVFTGDVTAVTDVTAISGHASTKGFAHDCEPSPDDEERIERLMREYGETDA